MGWAGTKRVQQLALSTATEREHRGEKGPGAAKDRRATEIRGLTEVETKARPRYPSVNGLERKR